MESPDNDSIQSMKHLIVSVQQVSIRRTVDDLEIGLSSNQRKSFVNNRVSHVLREFGLNWSVVSLQILEISQSVCYVVPPSSWVDFYVSVHLINGWMLVIVVFCYSSFFYCVFVSLVVLRAPHVPWIRTIETAERWPDRTFLLHNRSGHSTISPPSLAQRVAGDAP